MYIAITDQEQDALRGADYSLTVLYIYIKQFMDYKTGVVGYARRISYQGMSEALYIEPRAGVKGGSPHMSSIRRMVDQLLKCKILVKQRQDTLVFLCPMAGVENHVQNKADRKSTPQSDSVKPIQQQATAQKADRPKKPKADIPHLSLNPISKAAAADNEIPIAINMPIKNAAAADFIFYKSLSESAKQFMLDNSIELKDIDRQFLFDEIAGFIINDKITSSAMRLFLTFVKQFKTGTFEEVYATKIRKLRENQKASALEKPKEAPTAEQIEINKSKGRLAMASVHDILKGKKSA